MAIQKTVKQKKKKRLKIAIPKGRVLQDSLDLLRKAGYIRHRNEDYDSRRLVFDYEDDDISLLIVKPWDVPTFVEYGASDAGISGKDVLLEEPKNVYEPIDLKIGECRVVVAASVNLIKSVETEEVWINDFIKKYMGDPKDVINLKNDLVKHEIFKRAIYHPVYAKNNLRVATKYVNITKGFFNKEGVTNVQIIKLYGNIELAPISGLSDLIVDLVSTGETLKQNNLVPVEDILRVSSRLIINRASLKINPIEIQSLIDDLKLQIK